MTDDPVATFVQAALKKGMFADAREDSALHTVMCRAFRELYETVNGQHAFRRLLQHDSPYVTQWVAAQMLSEGDESAIPVLNVLARGNDLVALAAQLTLSEHRKGELESPFREQPSCSTGESQGWHGNRPAAEDVIQQLVDSIAVALPASYLDFLRKNNGGEGELGIEPGWCSLWRAEEIVELNRAYAVEELFPGQLAFGSDGGSEIFSFEVVHGSAGSVVMQPFVGDPEDAIVLTESFATFAKLIGVQAPDK